MATIPPHTRLKDVENAANFMALVQDNFEILAAETAKREATYQNGTPSTIIGPPTTGDHVADEFWRDALGGEWVCSVAGTPGTWKQIRPAAVTVDPVSGTIPTGYLIWNVSDGALKRKRCTGDLLAKGFHQGNTPKHGSSINTGPSQKIPYMRKALLTT